MDSLFRLYENVGDGSSKDILEAVMNNDCRFVISYYKAGGDLFYRDKKEETLLHKASRNNAYEIVDLLVKIGLKLDARNSFGETPLHLAVQFKNSTVADKLLFEKADCNATNRRKETPLHIAASRGNEDLVNLLLSHNAKINSADDNGAKPIHYAVKSGNLAIIRNLLNVGCSLMECDDRRNNVLHYACEKGDEDLVLSILRYMTVTDSRNLYGETPLHLASAQCSVKVVKQLVNLGYDIDACNVHQQNPIDTAIAAGNYQNSDFLKTYKTSTEYKERFLEYPLHRAVCQNNYEFLEQMLDPEKVNYFDYFGKTLMYYAINCGSLKTVEFLYKHGADIASVDDHHQSALLIAIYNENYKIIEFLLKKKANPNEIFYNRSYLYRAILRNNYDIAKILIDYGADVNYIDNKYRTIYSYAVEYAQDDIIELLLDKKASML